jgi:WD40 repeat protein
MASAGASFGPYTILGSIGSGGMGEVFRARDSRLDRDVAIKVLPAQLSSDPERLRRFEQEARAAAALNHPNLLAIFDIGTQPNGSPYIVSELLEGETLRQRLRSGAIPLRKAAEYASQIAHGMAAAHSKGIVHRDLKPENIYVTKDGRAKILDFGLAKLTQKTSDGNQTFAPTQSGTTPGMVIGTVGYMSPEQVRGQEADHRSDIFSFGAILYEMLSGKRAFHGNTTADTISAILKEDPPELSETNRSVPPALERVVRHCLEKNPEERFQSARDIAFDLESLSGVSSAVTGTIVAALGGAARRRRRFAIAGTIALAVVAAASFFTGGALVPAATPVVQQLTFRNGNVGSGRFDRDGHNAYFSAAWASNPEELFSLQPPPQAAASSLSDQVPPMQTLGIRQARILSVGPSSEMLVLTDIRRVVGNVTIAGTLAEVDSSGGAPHPLLDNVSAADYAPDGKSMAVVRVLPGNAYQLEYPSGTPLYRAPGYLDNVRFSRDGKRIAFLDHPVQGDDRGAVATVDLKGRYTKLTADLPTLSGMAWAPHGDVWFGVRRALLAVSGEGGTMRVLMHPPRPIDLLDVSSTGRALVNFHTQFIGMMALPPGATEERDISWLDYPVPRSISDDGKRVLFTEQGAGNYSTYLGFTDGSPAIRLGSGDANSLSPDGQWAVALDLAVAPQVLLLPTGAGSPRRLTHDKLSHQFCTWFPDGNRLACIAVAKGEAVRTYAIDVATGNTTPITPPGMVGLGVSPDGRYLGVASREPRLWDLQNQKLIPIKGLQDHEDIVAWGKNDQLLTTQREGSGIHVSSINPFTGEHKRLRELSSTAVTGFSAVFSGSMAITPDAKSYVYRYALQFGDLAAVSGLH